ncbi:hypothetical protein LTR09_003326 [Extremus antarcticus]|uniref:Uncharacterized protein n=1 Tax=Extremus antarcticus TaxID=702011 RepID=A0AAJ0GEQ8_9PEZI|nr:hypothetical protein LTR09_003326 [Extremus antarcticus]
MASFFWSERGRHQPVTRERTSTPAWRQHSSLRRFSEEPSGGEHGEGPHKTTSVNDSHANSICARGQAITTADPRATTACSTGYHAGLHAIAPGMGTTEYAITPQLKATRHLTAAEKAQFGQRERAGRRGMPCHDRPATPAEAAYNFLNQCRTGAATTATAPLARARPGRGTDQMDRNRRIMVPQNPSGGRVKA